MSRLFSGGVSAQAPHPLWYGKASARPKALRGKSSVTISLCPPADSYDRMGVTKYEVANMVQTVPFYANRFYVSYRQDEFYVELARVIPRARKSESSFTSARSRRMVFGMHSRS